MCKYVYKYAKLVIRGGIRGVFRERSFKKSMTNFVELNKSRNNNIEAFNGNGNGNEGRKTLTPKQKIQST